jgi:hypothetical protein
MKNCFNQCKIILKFQIYQEEKGRKKKTFQHLMFKCICMSYQQFPLLLGWIESIRLVGHIPPRNELS